MEDQWPEQSPISPAFGRRRVRPCVCVIDRKQHIRTFLCDALEELGFITCECAQLGELDGALNTQLPDLIVLGLSAGGEEAVEVLKTLAVKEFGGKIPEHKVMIAGQHHVDQTRATLGLPTETERRLSHGQSAVVIVSLSALSWVLLISIVVALRAVLF